MNNETEKLGLTNENALKILHDDIEDEYLVYVTDFQKENLIQKLKLLFFKNLDNPLALFPILITIYVIISLFISFYYISGIILLGILCLSIFIVNREDCLRRTEIYRKIKIVLDEIALGVILCKDWTHQNYPHLCSPLSPCVTLQWTYRDGEIVNLPWALLVRGDFIVMRPGQIAPGACYEVNRKKKFKCGETYGLCIPMEPPVRPTARSPLPDLICIMDCTPYLENLRTSLNCFYKRPETIYNQQRHLLITRCIQQWGSIVIIIVTVGAAFLHFFETLFEMKQPLTKIELFFELPASALLPILPLIFPMMWIFLNLWGTAQLETLLSIPQPIVHSDFEKSFQEDLDTPTFDWEHASLPVKQIFFNWLGLLNGSSELLGRSSNVVQVFGSVTAFCCIDKKGILSWPNPTAEKVFFLRDSADLTSEKSDDSSLDSDSTTTAKSGTIAEVLDLTHDQHSPFKLEFDDHEWKNHINSLKPLGLRFIFSIYFILEK